MKPQNLIHILIGIACIRLLPQMQAVSPAPDGGYPNATTAEGTNALFSLTTGINNTAIGFQALYRDTDGMHNVATGAQALFSNTAGDSNTANGTQALYFNTTGSSNTATGLHSLFRNTTGLGNTANGALALQNNTTGNVNTADGNQALQNNTTGYSNTAIGNSALFSNTIGHGNEAIGWHALYRNTSGYENTADGPAALQNNRTGIFNVAVGSGALRSNVGGSNNVAVGHSAGDNLGGSNNIALGAGAGSNLTGSNNICIGAAGLAGQSNSIRIGTSTSGGGTSIANIAGVAVSGPPVVIDNDGQLGVSASSARFKDEIKPMDKASEVVLALRPVTFHYKRDIDPAGTPQFGLVAEDVEKINPDLVGRDKEGKPYTVRYDAVNAMLLNEFLKEHQKVEQLTKDFETKFAEQRKQIESLTTGLQKVSAQLEVNKSAPQTVLNNQ